AVAGILTAAAFITSSNFRGAAGHFTGGLFPQDGSRPAPQKAAIETHAGPAQSRFAVGGIQTDQPLQGEQLFAWQIKPHLGQGVERPRDLLGMISTPATQAGRNCIASQQLVEAIVKNAGPKDRVSLWMVSTPDESFTKCLTKNFVSPTKEDKQIRAALDVLGKEYPAGDSNLKA